MNRLLLEQVDHVIHPQTGQTHWSDFEDFDRLFKKGREAAQHDVEKILNKIKRRNSLWGRFKHWIYILVKRWHDG